MNIQPARWSERDRKTHGHAVVCAKSYRRVEAELLFAIDEVEKQKVFKLFDKNLHAYCVDVLKLPDSVARYFVTVAHKCRAIPRLRQLIASGETTVALAARVTKVMTPETQDEWLSRLTTHSMKELKRAVAIADPKSAQPDRLEPIGPDANELVTTLTDACAEKLQRVRDLEIERTGSATTYAETIEAALEAYLDRHDPLRKSERALKRPENSGRPESEGDDIPTRRRHEVNVRDQCGCQVLVNGEKCTERKWLAIHHIILRSEGGTHDLDNLITLCGFHHRLLHERREAMKNSGRPEFSDGELFVTPPT